MPAPGLLHKYRGRALLTVTGACAIHCRYCFRRHFPYSDANPANGNLQDSLDYLRQHTDIHEIILSGGDPLTLSDARLQSLTEQLAAVPQLHTLRIHTRLPVVLPERVDPGLLAWIGRQRLQVVIVVHSNHPNEIDLSVTTALQRLRSAGVTVLNQSVLLHGINDDAATLIRLSESLFAAGVLPYYLHLLDKVQGAAHFAVIRTLRERYMQRESSIARLPCTAPREGYSGPTQQDTAVKSRPDEPLRADRCMVLEPQLPAVYTTCNRPASPVILRPLARNL